MTELLFIRNSKEFRTRKALVKEFLNNPENTYYDQECTKLQCSSEKFRSLSDIHMIVKSKFKVTSLESTIKIIYNLIDSDSVPVSMVWCTMVNKVVLKYLPNDARKMVTDYSRKNYYKSEGVDGLSLEKIENIYKK